MQNPYSPPAASLSNDDAAKSPGKRWKLYFVVLVGLAIAGYSMLGVEWMQPLDLVDLFTTSISCVGLFGYVFERRFVGQKFWRTWLPIVVVWDLAYLTIFHALGIAAILPDSESTGIIDQVLNLLLLAPLYLGLFRYGFRCSVLWDDHAAA